MIYLSFFLNLPASNGKRTSVWDVVSKHHGDLLGQVRWHGPWRQYCFYPTSGTIFNPGCLGDIGAFVNARTAEHRATQRPAFLRGEDTMGNPR